MLVRELFYAIASEADDAKVFKKLPGYAGAQLELAASALYHAQLWRFVRLFRLDLQVCAVATVLHRRSRNRLAAACVRVQANPTRNDSWHWLGSYYTAMSHVLSDSSLRRGYNLAPVDAAHTLSRYADGSARAADLLPDRYTCPPKAAAPAAPGTGSPPPVAASTDTAPPGALGVPDALANGAAEAAVSAAPPTDAPHGAADTEPEPAPVLPQPAVQGAPRVASMPSRAPVLSVTAACVRAPPPHMWCCSSTQARTGACAAVPPGRGQHVGLHRLLLHQRGSA